MCSTLETLRSSQALPMPATGRERAAPAERTLNKAARRHPDSAAPHNALARLHLDRGHNKKAESAANKARDLEPEHAETQLVSGLTWLAVGAASKAVVPLRNAAEAMPLHPEVVLNLCAAERQAGNGDEALDACGLALELVPDDATLKREFADLLIAEGSYRQGLAAWEELLRDSSSDVELTVRVVGLLLSVEAVEEAMAIARMAQSETPGSGDLMAAVGQVQQAMFQGAEAEVSFKKAVDSAPKSAFVRSATAIYYADMGNLTAAKKQLAKVQALEAEGVEAKLAAAAIDLAAGRASDALRALEPLAERHPEELRVQAQLARAYEASGQQAQADDIRGALSAARR